MRVAAPILALACAVATSAPATAKDPEGSLPYYENPSTLSGVAAKFHVSVDEIARLNGIKDKDHFHRHGLLLPDVPSTRGLPRYVPWAPAKPRAACPVTPWKFVDTSENGCKDAYCGTGPEGRACLCRDAKGDTTIILTTSAKVVRFPVEISDFNPWESSIVAAASADVDGDGRPEIMLSVLWGVSNGVGEEFRELIVVRDGREMLRYDSGEHTASTALVRVGKECHLASSHWEEVTHPLKGRALHLVERTFDPIHLRADRELSGRRFGERESYELPFDPLAPRTLPTLSGKVIEVSRVDQATTIRFQTSSGTKKLRYARFGDARSRRAFPLDLVPSKVPSGEALLGHSDETDIVWLLGP